MTRVVSFKILVVFSNMELIKIKSISLLLLLVIFSSSPYLTYARGLVDPKEIYEIDYRGPETHTSIPPPNHSRHGKHKIHSTINPKSLNSFQSSNNEEKIH